MRLGPNLRRCKLYVTLMYTDDEKCVLDKSVYGTNIMQGTLRESSSIVSPTIRIYADEPPLQNYAHIPEFGRYYYVSDVVSVRNNVWDISLVCDVLMTFKEAIRAADAVLEATETTGIETYLPGEAWVATAKSKTDIIAFNGQLLDTGEYILITSGGIGGI